MADKDIETHKRLTEEASSSSKRARLDRPRLPISKTDIKEMIESGYYADKTEYAWRLIRDGGPTFLIRPRRFGKSLFIKTLNKICQGAVNKEIFKGTWIYNSEYEWKKYPIINLDFSKCSHETPQELKTGIKKALYGVARAYNLAANMPDPKQDDDVQSYFEELFYNLLNNLCNDYAKKVIVLLDEYDAPVINLDAEKDKELKIANTEVLKSFFKVLKSEQDHIQLSFITGVTKFSLTDVVSASDLVDISLWPEYAAIGGYELEDIKTKFDDHRFEELADIWLGNGTITLEELDKSGSKKQCILDNLTHMYNGYKFHEDGSSIFNPVSVLSCFQEKKLNEFWSDTAKSTLVINQISKDPKRFKVCFDDYSEYATRQELSFSDTSNNDYNLNSLLYQTGYFTIQGSKVENKKTIYKLGFANQEVKDSLRKEIQDISTNIAQNAGKQEKSELSIFFNRNEWDNFFYRLYHYCFSLIPYDCFTKKERCYQGIFNAMLRGGDIPISGESHNNLGRSDGKIEDFDKTCVIEYKLNVDSETAFNQAYDKYTGGLWRQSKNVVVIGINFVHGASNHTPNHHNIDSVYLKVFSPKKEHLATFRGHFENGDIVVDKEWEKPESTVRDSRKG